MKSIITVGLGFGDEGKGTVVDALVRRYNAKLVIRYNGGAQCAHNVITDDGRHHCFHQFGSGSLVPGCRTLLTKHVLVNPLVMFTEALQLEMIGVPNALKNMFIDERALVTTPYHRAMNRLREYSRNEQCHGSCGMGIGETMADSSAARTVRCGSATCSIKKFCATSSTGRATKWSRSPNRSTWTGATKTRWSSANCPPLTCPSTKW
jgi:adenylosuccinate synthase